MKTLQEQYNLIKEGKGDKNFFIKNALRQFPNLINNLTSYNSAINILKSKNIITENLLSESMIYGIVTPSTPDWVDIFKENTDKAEEKKTSKNIIDLETKNYNYRDEKDTDNIYGEEFLQGYYTEMKDPKNSEKSLEELKKLVAKNLSKDKLYYTKEGQFGTKGVGYTEEIPGLGISKDPKGKYKSSGYGNLNENNPLKKTKINPKYTHFALRKSDNKIATGWEYKGLDNESIKEYTRMDLKDMDYKPSDFIITTVKSLKNKNIDPFDSDNWIKI
jgi:hypothetical protein